MFTFIIQYIDLSIDHSTQRESKALMVNSGLFLFLFFFKQPKSPHEILWLLKVTVDALCQITFGYLKVKCESTYCYC